MPNYTGPRLRNDDVLLTNSVSAEFMESAIEF